MKTQKGQAATEWIFMMSIIVALAMVVLENSSDVIRSWYQGAGQIIANAGVKKGEKI